MKIATFGELMLRLSPPDHELLFQSPALKAAFGGAEANVAVSLARFGHTVCFISVVPGNDIGEAALRSLRQWGVETSTVVRRGLRLGLYFSEPGANQRASKVIYDREHSALVQASKDDIDWEKALAGAEWFHTTGITPALSGSAADLVLDAMRTAKAMGLMVSVDLNFRSKLWKYGRPAPEVMAEVFALADVGMGNEEDCQKALGIEGAAGGGHSGLRAYEELTLAVMRRFPNLQKIALTLRESRSADRNVWTAVLRTRDRFLSAGKYFIDDIVDRIGAGDAFAAGLIHGLAVYRDDQAGLDFAAAASCLKHSTPGDFNLASESDVLALVKGEASGRVQR